MRKCKELFSFQNLRRVNFFTILTLILGIIFAANPGIIEKTCIIAGCCMAVIGVILLIVYFVQGKSQTPLIVTSILLMIGGIFLGIVTTLLKTLIPIFFGIWLIINSIDQMVQCYELRKYAKRWWIGFLIAALSAFVGVYVIAQPVKIIEYTIRLIGIAMIIHSILQLISVCFERRPRSAKDDNVIEVQIEE